MLMKVFGKVESTQILYQVKYPKDKIKNLFINIRAILKKAIQQNGTTIIDFSVNGESGKYTNELKIYGKENSKCFNCKSEIKKIRVAGRGTYICVKCQKNIINNMEPTKILRTEYKELHNAVAKGQHEYHCFYLATVNFKTPRLRTVVLRSFNKPKLHIFSY